MKKARRTIPGWFIFNNSKMILPTNRNAESLSENIDINLSKFAFSLQKELSFPISSAIFQPQTSVA